MFYFVLLLSQRALVLVPVLLHRASQ